MSDKARALAIELETGHASLIETVEHATESEWTLLCEENGRTLGQLARHVVDFYEVVSGFIRALAEGGAPAPITYEWIDESNAVSAALSKNQTRQEIATDLRTSGARAAELVRSLTDQQLGRTGEIIAEAGPMRVEDAVRGLLIAHEQLHLASMRTAVDGIARGTARSPSPGGSRVGGQVRA